MRTFHAERDIKSHNVSTGSAPIDFVESKGPPERLGFSSVAYSVYASFRSEMCIDQRP